MITAQCLTSVELAAVDMLCDVHALHESCNAKMHISAGRVLCLQKRPCLVRLDANNCPQLADVRGLRVQPMLTSLNISGCTRITALPELDTKCLSEVFVADTALEGMRIAQHFQVIFSPSGHRSSALREVLVASF